MINGNDPIQVEQTIKNEVIQFGDKDNHHIKIKYLNNELNGLSLQFQGEEIKSPLHGSYNLSNVAAAIAFGIIFKVKLKDIQDAISNYKAKNNRSQYINMFGVKIILDAYNANPSSMLAALRAFSERYSKNNSVILGDMMELGDKSADEHNQILKMCVDLKIQQIITIGVDFKKTIIRHPSIKKFESLEKFINEFKKGNIKFNSVLIKGSRSMKLERIISFFESL